MDPITTLVLVLGLKMAPVPAVEPAKQLYSVVYAYSSTVGQTDASPFVTASGERVRDGIVANNCLPFGTVVTFPEIYGAKEFVVTDRMAARYGCNSFDIWFPDLMAARTFGVHRTTVSIY